jgi:hypothetical protein
MTIMRSPLLLLVIGCGSGPLSNKDGVAVELGSVTLADDCGDHGYIAPPAEPSKELKEAQVTEKAAMADVASCPKDADCGHSGALSCNQTSMQLSFKAAAPATVKVKRVELLDDKSMPIQELTARLPKSWNGRQYTAWNEQLAKTDRFATSYALSAPNWEKLGGRMKAQGHKYHLRVTITVGDTDHTVEKQSISPVVMQPDVVTQIGDRIYPRNHL